MRPSIIDDVREGVALHPWLAATGAAIFGVWLALEEPRTRRRQLARLGAAAVRAMFRHTRQRVVAWPANVLRRDPAS
jgi:hypothetical protein